MARVSTIFNGNTNSSNLTVTDEFANADFLFIVANNLVDPTEGFEFAAELQINLKIPEIIGGVNIVTDYGTKTIPLIENSVYDTANILFIPREIAQTNIPCQLVLLTQDSLDLTIYSVSESQVTNNHLRDLINQTTDDIDIVISILNLLAGNPIGLLPLLPDSVPLFAYSL